jgi:hypothetical protein
MGINFAKPANTFGVGPAGREVYILRPIPQHISSQEALGLAAWLAVTASTDPEGEFFPIFNSLYLERLDGKLIF